MVAGRFWCSYARVSLTQTAPVRPRGWVQACAGVPARSFRRCVPWCAVCRRCAVVCSRCRCVAWCGCIPLFVLGAGRLPLLHRCAVVPLYLSLSLASFRSVYRSVYRYLYRYLYRLSYRFSFRLSFRLSHASLIY